MATLQDHIDTIELYLKSGAEPGSGTRAILENNLCDAVRRLDATSLEILPQIVTHVFRNVPGNAWGSKAVVDAWIRARRRELAAAHADRERGFE